MVGWNLYIGIDRLHDDRSSETSYYTLKNSQHEYKLSMWALRHPSTLRQGELIWSFTQGLVKLYQGSSYSWDPAIFGHLSRKQSPNTWDILFPFFLALEAMCYGSNRPFNPVSQITVRDSMVWTSSVTRFGFHLETLLNGLITHLPHMKPFLSLHQRSWCQDAITSRMEVPSTCGTNFKSTDRERQGPS